MYYFEVTKELNKSMYSPPPLGMGEININYDQQF